MARVMGRVMGRVMARRQLDAAFVWNWNSLVGCVQGALRTLDLPHEAAWVSGALGEAMRTPPLAVIEDAPAFARSGYPPRPLQPLAAPLASLGLRGRLVERDLTRPRRAWSSRAWFLHRSIRMRIDRGLPVVAYGAGVADFALIVGYDSATQRYRVSGPLTEQVGDQLPYDRLPNAGAPWLAIFLPERARPDPEAGARLALARALAADPAPILERWRGVLDGDAPIAAAGHAYWAAALGAARGEAARFWREAGRESAAEGYGRVAVAMSRFCTLFPYPAGGNVRGAAERRVGARMLAEVIAAEREALDTLARGERA